MEPKSISAGVNLAGSDRHSELQKLKEMAQDFEAILIASLLKEAQPREPSGLFVGGLSQDLYRQLFTDEIAKAIARSGGIGVGRMLERQLRATLRPGAHDNRLKEPSRPADVTKGDSK
ncbi:MAG: hypothetical protein C3F12_12730 [Candidatus Methylomirabilota bacterium]|nr:hypothetical protein [candidate division NC10 bacterium]PWB43519.1 MAG: hypothetical protein C3F12_12730 [candidate division NC10 bacterium]